MSIFNGNCGGGGGSAVVGAHASTHETGGSDQITPAMISAAPASHTHTPAQVGLPNAESTTNKNQPNGYAGLNSSGQVPAALLPSYVDDIVEVANAAALPATGDASVVYVALDTSKAYRWGGSAYVEITASPGSTDSVVEGSVNLYFTAARAAAAQINADWNSASGKSQILNKPALGTAASKDVAATGNALAGQVVMGDDTRLTDPRTAISHTHPQSEVTGLVDDLASLTLSDRIPSRADFDARAAAVRALTAGSGFLEWGAGPPEAWGSNILPGMYVGVWGDADKKRILFGGIRAAGTWTGSPPSPFVSCAGVMIQLVEQVEAPAWTVALSAPPPNAASLPARSDYLMMEVWHERVGLKDFVYPLGNVQYGAVLKYSNQYVLADGSIPELVNSVVPAGHSAYGSWELSPVAGYGLRWSDLSDSEQRAFAADPANNVYIDNDGALIQVRWRFRWLTGLGMDWASINPLAEDANDICSYTNDPNAGYGIGVPVPRGQYTENNDWGLRDPHTKYVRSTSGVTDDVDPGAWVCCPTVGSFRPLDVAHRGLCYALPIALVKRERNTGIYHATHNPGGCAENTGVLSSPSKYDVSPWQSVGALVITNNALAVPGGGFGSLLDDQDSVGDQAYLFQETNVPADTADYTFSVYLHKGNFNGSLLEFNLHAQSGRYGTGEYAQMSIDWTTNTATTSGTLTVKSSSMTSVGGGWYRLVCTVANNSYGYATMKIYPCQGYTGQRGSVYAYDAAIKREVSSLSDCFSTPKSGGLLGTTTAHPSGAYADEIIPVFDIVDMRMSAHRLDAERVLRRSFERYRAGMLRRQISTLAASSVNRAAIAISPVACPSGVLAEGQGYNPITGEVIYPATYAGTGAVSVATLISRNGQACMQIASDPAADGVVDIDLSPNTLVELPYYLPAEE